MRYQHTLEAQDIEVLQVRFEAAPVCGDAGPAAAQAGHVPQPRQLQRGKLAHINQQG